MTKDRIDNAVSIIEAITNPHIDFTTTRNVKVPNKANMNDAGTDIYVPEYDPTFLQDLIVKNPGRNLRYSFSEYDNGNPTKLLITIMPHERILIPSGIKVNIKNKWSYLKVDNKSGIANGKGLIFGSDIIDADYRGECHISVINTSDENQTITTGMKLVQLIHSIKLPTQWNMILSTEFDELPETDRMSGGFGSSGLY